MLFTDKFEMLYAERSLIKVENGRVIVSGSGERHNIPQKNLQVLVMGKGTSITHDAVEKLAIEGVQIVWSGASGMPYIAAGVTQYHPTQLQRDWIAAWNSEAGRLEMAKSIFQTRLEFAFSKLDPGIVDSEKHAEWLESGRSAASLERLLGFEGARLNWLYSQFARANKLGSFKRDHAKTDTDTMDNVDRVNAYLSHGNALAYGVAAGAMWHLGLSPAYPLVHGLTRNGGLIFDAADLIKDAIILPWAWDCYSLPIKPAMYELRHRIKKSHGDRLIVDTLKKLPGIVSCQK